MADDTGKKPDGQQQGAQGTQGERERLQDNAQQQHREGVNDAADAASRQQPGGTAPTSEQPKKQ